MMFYKGLRANIFDFIQTMGVVDPAQIQLMFNKHGDKTVEFQTNSLIREHAVRLGDNGRIHAIGVRETTPFAEELIIKAGWVIANYGEDGILEFYPCKYPSQFIFISAESPNRVYDITVFTYSTQAAIAQIIKHYRDSLTPPDVIDEIVHIALVTDAQMADEIKNLGFDCYGILNEKNIPIYANWGA